MKTALTLALRYGLKPLLTPAVPRGIQRFAIGAATAITRGHAGVNIRPSDLAGRPALRVAPKSGNPATRMLYLHGGGYVVGGFASHRKLASQVAAHTGAEVMLLDYRLAPEHPYPAALNDAVAAYKAMAAQGDDPILIAGDSAGGGLALATALALADDARAATAADSGAASEAACEAAPAPAPRQPAGLVLFSPWVDLDLTGESIRTLADRDAMLSLGWLEYCAQAYAGPKTAGQGSVAEESRVQGGGRRSPGCSPLYASPEQLSALPPVLIQVGGDEMLLSDAQRMAVRLKDAGVPCDLQMSPGMGHVFQVFAGWLPEADEALINCGKFTNKI